MRDTELRLRGHLHEIAGTNDDVLGGRQGFPSAINGYERTLESVAECATVDELDHVAELIKNKIRKNEERPSNRKIRREARSIVSKAGYPPDEFLNAA